MHTLIDPALLADLAALAPETATVERRGVSLPRAAIRSVVRLPGAWRSDFLPRGV